MLRVCLAFVVLVLGTAVAGGVARAQTCSPGDEFCLPPPPCYRAPDDPDCNADCTCASADYPACDPYCAPGDLCDPDCANPCWDEFGRDLCSDPPPPCMPMGARPFEFVDDMDGMDDGQVFALGDRDPMHGCGTLLVDRTGYYSIYDMELSESCATQLDETGYLTIANSCNADGWAVQRNAGDRFLVFDSDNTPACGTDADCDSGKVCRPGTGSSGSCCVPNMPVFMGTFLLVAGEPNAICINHWCPEWRAEIAAGRDFGFVVAGCEGVNSIHFRIDATAIACEDATTLQPCSWGCSAGSCLPDPCDAMSCAAYCMDGMCRDDNPCDALTCEHGCVRGRCLQNRHARGPDADGDGYSELADCDDHDPAVHPGRPERCGNGVDDNCDGHVDEMPCDDGGGTDGGTGARRDGGPGGGGAGVAEGSCGCDVPRAPGRGPVAFMLGLALLLVLRRRG